MLKKRYQTSNIKSFTLIELMIVVVILSILSGATIAVINSAGFQGRARDSQRAADIKKIQTALELYFADNRKYPPNTSFQRVTATALTNTLVNGGYISSIPQDPKFPNTGATNTACSNDRDYLYRSDSNGSIYVLSASMELEASAASSRCLTTVVPNCSTFSCNCTGYTRAYCVQNP